LEMPESGVGVGHFTPDSAALR